MTRSKGAVPRIDCSDPAAISRATSTCPSRSRISVHDGPRYESTIAAGASAADAFASAAGAAGAAAPSLSRFSSVAGSAAGPSGFGSTLFAVPAADAGSRATLDRAGDSDRVGSDGGARPLRNHSYAPAPTTQATSTSGISQRPNVGRPTPV